ncbi:molybdopterin dinucleotide binding domain-containing protein, partial [Micromonospora chalcea]
RTGANLRETLTSPRRAHRRGGGRRAADARHVAGAQPHVELGTLPRTRVERPSAPSVEPAAVRQPGAGEAVLSTWHQLIDLGSLTDGDEHLAGTARPPVVRLGKGTAESLGVADGDAVTVGTDRGAVTLPAAITEMPDGVVWLPTNSPGSTVRRSLGATSGSLVKVSVGAAGGSAVPAGRVAADAADRPGPLLNTGSAQ